MLRTWSYEYWVLHCIELDIFKIEFYVAFFIEANYSCNSISIKSSFIYVELDFHKIEFQIKSSFIYVELDFHKIEFQKDGILLNISWTVLLCKKNLIIYGIWPFWLGKCNQMIWFWIYKSIKKLLRGVELTKNYIYIYIYI